MIEFAVVLPLLVILVCGVIDFGRAFYVYNALSSVARDAARYAGGLECTAYTAAKVQSRFRDTYVQFLGGTTTAAPTPTVTPTANEITVALSNHSFTAWTPLLPVARTLTFTVSAVFRRESGPC
jgi:Flp pilus assembly protein TadG